MTAMTQNNPILDHHFYKGLQNYYFSYISNQRIESGNYRINEYMEKGVSVLQYDKWYGGS